MAYKIRTYSKIKAKQLGVEIKPSSNKKKKLDVFNKQGKKLASIGALGMNDYPTYMELEKNKKVEKGTAEKRRKLYKNRHESDRKKVGTNGYYADKILW
jgi:hypothetical protein